MTEDKNRNDDRLPPREQPAQKPRFLDGRDSRPATLGKIRTEEEARLAAEIEKLR